MIEKSDRVFLDIVGRYYDDLYEKHINNKISYEKYSRLLDKMQEWCRLYDSRMVKKINKKG